MTQTLDSPLTADLVFDLGDVLNCCNCPRDATWIANWCCSDPDVPFCDECQQMIEHDIRLRLVDCSVCHRLFKPGDIKWRRI